MTGSFKALIFALGLAVALSGNRGLATEHEAWTFQCMEDESSDARICTTELTASQDGQDFLIYFVHNKGGKSPLVVTGGDLPFSALTIKVDNKEPLSADHCEVGMCYFDVKKSQLMLKQFTKGRSARVSIVDDRLHLLLDAEITLRGFSASYAKY